MYKFPNQRGPGVLQYVECQQQLFHIAEHEVFPYAMIHLSTRQQEARSDS